MLARVSTNIINHSNAANKFRTLLTAEREYNNDVDVIYRSLVDNERINFYTVHILAYIAIHSQSLYSVHICSNNTVISL